MINRVHPLCLHKRVFDERTFRKNRRIAPPYYGKLEFMSSIATKPRKSFDNPSSYKLSVGWIFAAIVSVLVMVMIPFLIITPNASAGLTTPMIVVALCVALPPIAVAVLAIAQRHLKRGLSPRQRAVASTAMIPTLVLTIMFALVVVMVMWVSGADRNPVGYQMLTSWGLLSYILLGGTPVVTYTLFILGSFKKATFMMIAMGAISLLAIWLWAGYAINLVGGSLW